MVHKHHAIVTPNKTNSDSSGTVSPAVSDGLASPGAGSPLKSGTMSPCIVKVSKAWRQGKRMIACHVLATSYRCLTGPPKGYLILSGEVLLLDFQCIIDWEPDFMKLNVNI